MNNYQKLQNEQFLIKMSKILKSWLWNDTEHDSLTFVTDRSTNSGFDF